MKRWQQAHITRDIMRLFLKRVNQVSRLQERHSFASVRDASTYVLAMYPLVDDLMRSLHSWFFKIHMICLLRTLSRLPWLSGIKLAVALRMGTYIDPEGNSRTKGRRV